MGIIKQFQDNYFESRRFAATPEGGYSAPDFVKIAKAYGIDAFSVKKPGKMKNAIKKVLAHKGPIICDVWIDEFQQLIPRIEFGRPLEDMFPYLLDREFYGNMIVSPMPRQKKKIGWQAV